MNHQEFKIPCLYYSQNNNVYLAESLYSLEITIIQRNVQIIWVYLSETHWYGSGRGCNTAPERQLYIQPLLKKG